MEIISLMLREQDPATLARAAAQRSTAEQRKDSDELASILRRENAEKEAKMKKMVSSRSSIFRGTFCVKDVKSISERELIVHHQVECFPFGRYCLFFLYYTQLSSNFIAPL